jgi:hypothetical protein
MHFSDIHAQNSSNLCTGAQDLCRMKRKQSYCRLLSASRAAQPLVSEAGVSIHIVIAIHS